jgi:uncharacterized membrane-anchored protein
VSLFAFAPLPLVAQDQGTRRAAVAAEEAMESGADADGGTDAEAAGPQHVEVGRWGTVDLASNWQWLQGREGQRFLESLGNPPDQDVLGVAVDEQRQMFDVYSYEDDGHVDDADAAGIDYDALLQSMQEDVAGVNEQRRKNGYPTVELLGWAQRPHYDAAGKKLYWAKRLQFADGEGETVNYDVRVLGRSGVLVLQAVGDMQNLQQVADGCQELLVATEFVPGQRYTDFDASLDKVAAYGIGGLIAGKVLLKAGLLKLLLKPLLIAGGLLVVFLGKVVKGRGREDAAPAPTA